MLLTASVSLGVTAASSTAAVLHAVWNAVAHAIGDQLVGFALIGVGVTAGALASSAKSIRWPGARSPGWSR